MACKAFLFENGGGIGVPCKSLPFKKGATKKTEAQMYTIGVEPLRSSKETIHYFWVRAMGISEDTPISRGNALNLFLLTMIFWNVQK